MVRGLLVVTVLAGCISPDPNADVTGPFTGTPRRYVVDAFSLPRNNTDARMLGADLNGDDNVDNQLGMVISTLANDGNVTSHGADMIASGAIASSVIVRANDLVDDPSVSVSYYGSDGDPATKVGGRIEDGVFVSNRTATTEVPGAAITRLPIFVDADPSNIPLHHMQLELTPDGGDGYVASISGAMTTEDAFTHAWAGISQLIAADPDSHRMMRSLLDTNHDWTVTYEEFVTNSLLVSLLGPDLTIDNRELLSFGFHAHLKPCDAGTCIDAPPADACHDRVQNGDESDVDCGGSCRTCTTARQCSGPSDCESNACDAGRCRAPTCSDGVRDGYETDVDCGGPCADCALGARCWSNGDCASATCGEPCTNPDPFGCIDLSPDFDVCREAPPM